MINFFGLQDAVNALGRDLDGLPLPGSGPGLLDRGLLQQLRPQHPHRRLPGPERPGRPWPCPGPATSSTTPTASGPTTRPRTSVGSPRQNLIISAALDKAKSTYNPLRLNTLLTSVVHDFSKDDGLSANDLFSLAERYHAFSGSQLQTYTLPTAPAATSAGVGTSRWSSPTRPSQMITQFLGGPFGAITTPPIDAYGNRSDLAGAHRHADRTRHSGTGDHDDTLLEPLPRTTAPAARTFRPTTPALLSGPADRAG